MSNVLRRRSCGFVIGGERVDRVPQLHRGDSRSADNEPGRDEGGGAGDQSWTDGEKPAHRKGSKKDQAWCGHTDCECRSAVEGVAPDHVSSASGITRATLPTAVGGQRIASCAEIAARLTRSDTVAPMLTI